MKSKIFLREKREKLIIFIAVLFSFYLTIPAFIQADNAPVSQQLSQAKTEPATNTSTSGSRQGTAAPAPATSTQALMQGDQALSDGTVKAPPAVPPADPLSPPDSTARPPETIAWHPPQFYENANLKKSDWVFYTIGEDKLLRATRKVTGSGEAEYVTGTIEYTETMVYKLDIDHNIYEWVPDGAAWIGGKIDEKIDIDDPKFNPDYNQFYKQNDKTSYRIYTAGVGDVEIWLSSWAHSLDARGLDKDSSVSKTLRQAWGNWSVGSGESGRIRLFYHEIGGQIPPSFETAILDILSMYSDHAEFADGGIEGTETQIFKRQQDGELHEINTIKTVYAMAGTLVTKTEYDIDTSYQLYPKSSYPKVYVSKLTGTSTKYEYQAGQFVGSWDKTNYLQYTLNNSVVNSVVVPSTLRNTYGYKDKDGKDQTASLDVKWDTVTRTQGGIFGWGATETKTWEPVFASASDSSTGSATWQMDAKKNRLPDDKKTKIRDVLDLMKAPFSSPITDLFDTLERNYF